MVKTRNQKNKQEESLDNTNENQQQKQQQKQQQQKQQQNSSVSNELSPPAPLKKKRNKKRNRTEGIEATNKNTISLLDLLVAPINTKGSGGGGNKREKLKRRNENAKKRITKNKETAQTLHIIDSGDESGITLGSEDSETETDSDSAPTSRNRFKRKMKMKSLIEDPVPLRKTLDSNSVSEDSGDETETSEGEREGEEDCLYEEESSEEENSHPFSLPHEDEDREEVRDFLEAVDETFEYESVDELDNYNDDWKAKYTKEQFEDFTNQLEDLREVIRENTPSIVKILDSNLTKKQKASLIEKFHIYLNHRDFTAEKYIDKIGIMDFIKENSISDEAILKMIEEEEERVEEREPLKVRVYRVNTTPENKSIIYKRLKEYEQANNAHSTVEEDKREWLEKAIKVPFGIKKKLPVNKNSSKKKIREFIDKVRTKLDNKVSFMDDIKDEIINLVAMSITNESSTPRVIALEGPPGVGKTRLASVGIAESLNRPFFRIPVGMLTNKSSLSGDRKVYVGSEPGMIMEMVIQCGCMNPIILIDELDKVEGNPGIQEALLHILDPLQIKNYKDNYFSGLEFDLSGIMFILSYNNHENVNTIVSDRVQRFKIDPLDFEKKVTIAKNHIIPEVSRNIGIGRSLFKIPDDIIKYIINKSSVKEQGCRQLGRNIETILMKINTLNITGRLKEQDWYNNSKTLQDKRIVITKEIVDKYFKEPQNFIPGYYS